MGASKGDDQPQKDRLRTFLAQGDLLWEVRKSHLIRRVFQGLANGNTF